MAPKSVDGFRLLPGTQLQLTYHRKKSLDEVRESLQKRPIEIRVTENDASALRVKIVLPNGMYFYTLCPGQDCYAKYRVDTRSMSYKEITLHRKKGESCRLWIDHDATGFDIAQLRDKPILVETDRRRVLRFYLPRRWSVIKTELDRHPVDAEGALTMDRDAPVSHC